MIVSTGLFRLARVTGAAILPVIIFNTGRWQYQATVFEALPQDLVEAHNAAAEAAAASYLVECLIPPAVERPDQAMAVLAETIRYGSGETSR